MAYTTTLLESAITLVGTSGTDISDLGGLGFDEIVVNSFEGDDRFLLTSTTTVESGSIGMGGGSDIVDFGITSECISVALGDAADRFNLTAASADEVTVGGQGGADLFTISADATDSRFAGGQGSDEFDISVSVFNGSTVVGGSEDDEIDIVATTADELFVNGQVGEDEITITLTTAEDATVRGGSENDTITNDGVGISIFGDKGNDELTDGAGDSALDGGEGNDDIDGGAGIDTLTGGAGNDDFVFATDDGAQIDNDITAANIEDGDSVELIDVLAGEDIFTLNVITDFSAGDELDYIGLADGGDLAEVIDGNVADGTAYYLTGTFRATTGEFTFSADGADVLISTSGTAATELDPLGAAALTGASDNWTIALGAASAL